ncbi:MAG: 4-phosphopantetheinyl transferase family protein [Planctomycetes bacterium]|nr:4-phosphopantetheinyl transferase family protein [Planctomycetota bacterium]
MPLPSRGWYWSLSHCPSSVVGVVHACPVGVDVESLRTVRSDVAARVLSESELALFERRGELEFLRAWTGKEAVLKEFGVGLAGLERCRIVAVHDTRLELRFDGHSRVVHQSLQPRRVVSLSSADGAPPEFLVLDQPLLEPHEVQP